MADERDPLAAFDPDVVDAVAADHDLAASGLRDLASRHQESMRDLPGIDDLVYEWRTQFHDDPMVERTETAYYLTVREHVWEEFADALDLSERELGALQALHDRQLHAAVEPSGGGVAIVLTRE